MIAIIDDVLICLACRCVPVAVEVGRKADGIDCRVGNSDAGSTRCNKGICAARYRNGSRIRRLVISRHADLADHYLHSHPGVLMELGKLLLSGKMLALHGK